MMNKTIQETKKGIAVHKNIIVFFIIFLPFIVKGQSLDDYKILEVLFHNKDSVLLSQNANNLSLKGIFEENINDSLFIQAQKNRAWILKEKTILSSEEIEKKLDENILILRKVFTKENYEFIQNQMLDFVWNKTDIEKYRLSKNIIIDESKEQYVVSKPVYTKDNKYAIVKYQYNKATSVIILVKEHDNWKIIQFVPVGFG